MGSRGWGSGTLVRKRRRSPWGETPLRFPLRVDSPARAPRPGRACAGGARVAHRRVVQRGTRVAPFTSAVNHRLLFKRAPTAGIECDPELTCCVKSSRRTDRDAKKDWTGRCIVALPPGSRPEVPWMDGPPQGATSLSLLPRCTQAGGQGSLPSVVATWHRGAGSLQSTRYLRNGRALSAGGRTWA